MRKTLEKNDLEVVFSGQGMIFFCQFEMVSDYRIITRISRVISHVNRCQNFMRGPSLCECHNVVYDVTMTSSVSSIYNATFNGNFPILFSRNIIFGLRNSQHLGF